ncbi:MAG: glycine--tRNA ligase subunit beta [Thermoanaerobaculia bacterium]|nr:glycine--tRNA ligase subunit beta [Thermoanaerobaculia bacterium]
MSKGDLLVEVRCEEIPARMLRTGTEELATEFLGELESLGVEADRLETAFTPRRLVLMARGLPDREPVSDEVLTGPPAEIAFDESGNPTKAAEGFAGRCGLAVEDLEIAEMEKGDYVVARQQVGGRPTVEILKTLIPSLFRRIPWAKTMKWGEGLGPWVRPIHGLLALYKGELIPMRLFGIASGKTTVGHPILSPGELTIRGIGDYLRRLEEKGILVRVGEREARLREEMDRRARTRDGRLVEDQALLKKLAAICEIPGIMEGSFDREFLQLPREVLVTSLRDHQSAFTVEAEDGAGLLPVFLTVMDRPDDPEGRVRSGNEWVVAARLADARFFYGEDKKQKLEERIEALDELSFHVDLGSYAAKAERLVSLTQRIYQELDWEEDEGAEAAARLLKVDLGTEMVQEFPSLQGIMGGIYAREEGYDEAVWQAIYDQYLPSPGDDRLPRGRVGRACALADRIDTLVGIFGLGLLPSGSKDPFGLRRAARGIIRILLEGGLPLDFELMAAHAARQYRDRLDRGVEELLADLRPFFHDRLRHLLEEEGYAYDEVEAALGAGAANLPDLLARLQALHETRDDQQFLSIVLAAKRIENITGEAPEYELEPEALEEEAEQQLHHALGRLKRVVEESVETRDYRGALQAIAGLAETLERFFVEVLVMAEDPDLRRNRLALLQEIGRTLSRTADLTEIVVDKSEYRKDEGS